VILKPDLFLAFISNIEFWFVCLFMVFNATFNNISVVFLRGITAYL
jgi:hypothetical protein